MILTTSYFNQSNDFQLPQPTSIIPEVGNGNYLTFLIQEVEDEVLTDGLGFDLYALLKATPTAERFAKLINGDGKFEGVKKMLAYRIKEVYIDRNIESFTNSGVQSINADKAMKVSPQMQIAFYSLNFVRRYQEGYCFEPYIFDGFIDWFERGENPNRLSLYQYLRDNQSVYPEWKIDNFIAYEPQNSFGL